VNAVDLLETSLLVKKTAFHQQDPFPPSKKPAEVAKAVALAELYATPEPPIDPATGEPQAVDPPNEFETENVFADAALFEAVGVGISRQEMYNVMLAVKQLGEDPVRQVATVRFFGKFLGTHSDYYVFETTLQEAAAEEAEAVGDVVPAEAGSGTNGYTYFCCNSLGGPLTRLPDVTPQQITCARQIKKFFTGDLSASVSAYPLFPGFEAEFLRAQIARIAAATVVCPSGFFQLAEDSEDTLEKTEEFAPLEAEEMLEGASWSHRYPHIKAQGRCALWSPPPPEDEEEEAPPEEEPEVSPPLLTTIDQDAEVNGGAAWTTVISSQIPGVKYKVAAAKSNLWPGAAAVATGASFSNIYVGYGLKSTPFVPLPPPPVAVEYDASLVESTELPPRVEDEEDEEGEGEAAE